MSDISVEPTGVAAAAFFLMMIGAIGKAGSMPFHTWIPDAAIDAPVAVMAFIPAAFEKLLGIYLLARICLDFFKIETGSGLSLLLMTVGAVTIVLAVFMALDPEGPQAAAVLPRRLPGRLHDPGHRHGRAHRHRRRHLPHDQPRHVQERPVPEPPARSSTRPAPPS